MASNKHIDKICLVAALLALVLALVLLNATDRTDGGKTMGYESRLFDSATVHTIDLQMDDWEDFIATCEDESYHPCTVVIDGEQYANVGIRAKGNTSLRNVSAMGSQRYSFKLEFDQYDSGVSYYGLDKLCLNNIIQDNSYMKDFLTYQLMGRFGVAAPLCSYVSITVNGQDWGLYLAVEGIEEGFLQRNYGNDYGELYKPDSMDMGGGQSGAPSGMQRPNDIPDGFDPVKMQAPEQPAEAFDPGEMREQPASDFTPGEAQPPQGGPGGGGGSGFGGSTDVKLQYIDDDSDSYPNIFDNAKTDVSQADQTRLIATLRSLSQGENLGTVVDVEAVLRYFVVHNFVVNGDSYTGSMIHNYYLYEKDGQLSMLPWDYNLAFGTFTGGEASASVNDPIDEGLEDRPMQAWIFSDESYTQQYHALYAAFLKTVDIDGMIQQTAQLIAPYVEKDPTKFCTYTAFEAGVEALRTFCTLRAQSVQGQLNGTIPRLCQKTTVWGVPKPRLLCSRKKYPALLAELRPRGLKNNSPHPKAAIRFFIPTIFRARFILNAKNVNDNSPSAFWIPRSRSCLTPISCLTVPKGCSTIHFLWDEIALFCKMRIFFSGTDDISHSLLNSDFFIIRST